jgi:hypothetical protein
MAFGSLHSPEELAKVLEVPVERIRELCAKLRPVLEIKGRNYFQLGDVRAALNPQSAYR